MSAAKFEKKAIFELLADTIEAQIRQEGWKGLLPSGRDLADQHKVSVPTVQKAITLLVDRKVLVRRGGNRRVGVVAASPHQRAGGKCELLVLSAKPLSFYDSTIAMGMLQLAEELKARGDGYRFVDLSEKRGLPRPKAAHAETLVGRRGCSRPPGRHWGGRPAFAQQTQRREGAKGQPARPQPAGRRQSNEGRVWATSPCAVK